MTLHVVEDFAIQLAFFSPFGARRTDSSNGKSATDNLDVLAHPFIGICRNLFGLWPRCRESRTSLHSQHKATDDCCTRQSSHSWPSVRHPGLAWVIHNSEDSRHGKIGAPIVPEGILKRRTGRLRPTAMARMPVCSWRDGHSAPEQTSKFSPFVNFDLASKPL
jgi:hypothetical protein